MNWLAKLASSYLEKRGLSVTYPPKDPALAELFNVGRDAGSGVTVTENTAVGWTALSAGCRLISETLASLPLDVFERVQPRGRRQRPDHPAAQLFRWPNEEMTIWEVIDVMQSHALWWGNGYAQIVFDGAQRPIELWPLSPDRVTMERNSQGKIVYRVGIPAVPFGRSEESAVLPADEVLHIRGFTRYGLLGDRMVHVFRETIGLGLASELFGALLFGQGMNAGGILEHPSTLGDEAQNRLKAALEKQVKGLTRSHRTLILEEGMKWHQTTIEPEKAQYLGLRKFQVTEAARILRVPPHMLYDLERATFSNIEHQAIELVTYTFTPWAVRWEQRFAKTLLGRKDFERVYFKFNMNALLRGDMAARMNFYQSGIQNGWLSQNDVREYEDLNPIKNGDKYRVPANLTPVDAPPPVNPTPEPEPDDDDDDQADD